MKKIILASVLLTLLIAFYTHMQHVAYKKQAVNSILGDISFIEKFKHKPNFSTDEDLRVKTHLEYVEKLLRQKEVIALSPELRQRRHQLLDLLHNYLVAGVFPRNYDYRESRKPCFIDKDKRICAVGYLIEETAERRIAEEINSRHKYDELLAMNDKAVDSWIETSGLSKEECAMIQPTYGGLYPATSSNHTITPAYGISSAILGGANAAVNTLNLLQTFKGTNNKSVGVIGLITGSGQMILGLSSFPKKKPDMYMSPITNENKKNLSMVNVGFGAATLFLSTWRLITNKKPKDTKTTLNLNSFETPDNTMGMAVTFRRRIGSR